MTQRAGLSSVPRRGHPLRRRHAATRHTGLADEALVDRARGGDELAANELLLRYRGFARARVRNYFLVGGDREDVVQEAMIGLFKAIRDYDPGSGTSFRSFAELCITRQVLSAIRSATRHKHGPLNSSISLDRPHSAGSPRTVAEILPAGDEHDPLTVLVAADDRQRLRAALDDVLSGLESEVLALYLDGCSYEEIAAQVGRHAKAVDNALQRVKRKLEDRVAA
ncbi:MAG TPA: RNA polymerase sporulation sigma factor SigH [Egicoccus sp.]|nr:RNA polymerase sporulation sigma factor SigH [Egicoccus sp.]HSK24723.1 RNA polymerase sporulation sigma factor SigH [Egicoccus sp.]